MTVTEYISTLPVEDVVDVDAVEEDVVLVLDDVLDEVLFDDELRLEFVEPPLLVLPPLVVALYKATMDLFACIFV